jgi:Flp pilus assembly pilin Flp
VVIRRFFTEDDGQDIIEYALLSVFIGLIGVVAWNNISAELTAHYTGWGTGVNNLSGCSPDPIAAPGGIVCSGGS